MSLLRKLSKVARALPHPLARRALRHGAAPSWEHAALLAGLGPLDMVVDVGANVGQFAMLTRIVQPAARIVAFEPMRAAGDTFEALLRDAPDVTLHRLALGQAAAAGRINVSARADSSSLLANAAQDTLFPQTATIGTQDVQVVPLTQVLDAADITGTALLKIDVQGYEGAVLEGCAELLETFTWIYCEASFVELYAGQRLAHEIVDWLAARGFHLAGVQTDPLMVRQGRVVQADLLFRRSAG